MFPFDGGENQARHPERRFPFDKSLFSYVPRVLSAVLQGRNEDEPAASCEGEGGDGNGEGVGGCGGREVTKEHGVGQTHTHSHTRTHAQQTKERKPEKADTEGGRYEGLLPAEQQE